MDCGLAGIQDLRTNKRDDRMESFTLSETLKVSRLGILRLDILKRISSICFYFLMKKTHCIAMDPTMFSQLRAISSLSVRNISDPFLLRGGECAVSTIINVLLIVHLSANMIIMERVQGWFRVYYHATT